MYVCASVCVCVCVHVCYLEFLFPLQGELFEGLDDDARVGAVVHKYGRAAHPGLQVVDGEWDVLGVVLQSGGKKSRMRKHI